MVKLDQNKPLNDLKWETFEYQDCTTHQDLYLLHRSFLYSWKIQNSKFGPFKTMPNEKLTRTTYVDLNEFSKLGIHNFSI